MSSDEDCRTIYPLNAPLKNPLSHDLPEIEVTDLTHPLFGRRFPVVSRTSSPPGPGHVLVAYRQYMVLRIPVTATSLFPSLPVAHTKLTFQAVQDLVTLATQCEVLCPLAPPPSGPASLPNSKRKSGKNLPRSSRREAMTTSALITPQHLTRKAIIYIRQSSPHHVLTNQESLRLQYALRERARPWAGAPRRLRSSTAIWA